MAAVVLNSPFWGVVCLTMGLTAVRVSADDEALARQQARAREPARRDSSSVTTGSALANSLSQLGVILDGLRVPALVIERAPNEGVVHYATAAFAEFTGSKERVVGRSIHSLEGLQTSPETGKHLTVALRNGCAAQLKLRCQRHGSSSWNGLLITPLSDHDGRVSNFLCICLEGGGPIGADAVTPRDVRRIVLGKAEWESTIDSLQELVMLVDSEMRLIRTNRTIEEWNLGTVRTAKGRHLHEVLHRGCTLVDCPLLALWAQLSTGGEADHAVEYTAGDEILKRRIHVTMHAVRSKAGLGEAVAVVVRDVSQIHEREETLRRKERFEAMGHLVGGLAHEVGNPLAALKATVEVWSRNLGEFGDGDHSRFLSRLAAGIDRMQASVDRIRTWGRQEQYEDQVVSIGSIVEEIHALFLAQVTEASIGLALLHPGGPDLCVMGNPGAVYEVVVNVVKNAIEACIAGDRIAIEWLAEGGAVTLRVRDTGRGISESDMRHLFAPFFTTKPTGTGIGLAQANHLMEQMGARVDIQSSEGRGTTVTLRFRGVSEPEPSTGST